MPVEFVDTNVLVYAYDSSAGPKQVIARGLVSRLWNEQCGAVSIQVLQEFYVTVIRKAPWPLDVAHARQVVVDLQQWRVAVPDVAAVLEAIDASERYRISFGDAMILTAVSRLGAGVAWSEEMSPGQAYGSVVVRNPFTSMGS